jgi:hypothetical protein
VPAQCVIVDLKFSRCSLDRRASGKKPLYAHTLYMIATLATPGSRTFLPRHRLPPSPSMILNKRRHTLPLAAFNPPTASLI